MGDMHAACYRALAELGVQVTAVADVRPEFAKKLADTYGAKLYDTAEDMIEHADVDVIDICAGDEEGTRRVPGEARLHPRG